MNVKQGDIALLLPGRNVAGLTGTLVTVGHYIGDWYQVAGQCELLVRRAWSVQSSLFPSEEIVCSDDVLRPIRGDGREQRADTKKSKRACA